jgi:Flp pilus assembly CpaE family ATPase
MEVIKRTSPISPGPAVSEASGQVYAIVPAHGGSNADLVARQLSRELSEGYRLSVLLADFFARGFPLWGTAGAPQRLDGRTWGAFLRNQGAFDTLEAREAHPRNIQSLLDHARRRYQITCAELSEAKESSALEVLQNSDAIFIVTSSGPASVALAKFKADWLRSMNLDDRSALLLNRIPGGVGAAEVENRTGLPVCATVDDRAELRHLAGWLAAPQVQFCSSPIRLVG